MTNKLSDEHFSKYYKLGTQFFREKNWEAAKENFFKAIAIKPDVADSHNSLGAIFYEQGQVDEAIKYFRQAIEIKPDFGLAYRNLGMVFGDIRNFPLAAENLKKALNFGESENLIMDGLFIVRQQSCDWNEYYPSQKRLGQIASSNNPVPYVRPFHFLSISDSAKWQLTCADKFSNEIEANIVPLKKRDVHHDHKKIRLAYISANFVEHPMSYLMAGVFEEHDREKFEVIAISLDSEPDLAKKLKDKLSFFKNKGGMTQRLKLSFDKFIHAGDMSAFDVASLMQELEIDIAIDLMGFTQKYRFDILAHRPAPIQVNYLGYPGTLGSERIDYILADPYVIPSKYQKYYAEKIVYLPDCFQANDDKRKIDSHKPDRQEAGLPDSGFVFCAFNTSHKINPPFFDIWMRLLDSVPGSVLWAVADNQLVKDNLSNEAEKRGVNPERLIFANRLPYAEHLARFQLADLFLDTLPFNAGTTASDALWAGVPVLTCSGKAFASRMAGSLLHTIGLPELIAGNLEEYEATALELAADPEKLAEIRARLAENKNTYPLFDTKRFTRHVESAYGMMWERYLRGEGAASFSVPCLEMAENKK